LNILQHAFHRIRERIIHNASIDNSMPLIYQSWFSRSNRGRCFRRSASVSATEVRFQSNGCPL
jgi:hypothetical protein